MNYLRRTGEISDKSMKLFNSMFKYSNEDIMGIYEVFIHTKDYKEFVENIKVLQSSKYLE